MKKKKKNLPQKPKKKFFQESPLHPGLFFPTYLALLAFSLPKGKRKEKNEKIKEEDFFFKNKNLNSVADIS
jgi:hypothetical protein